MTTLTVLIPAQNEADSIRDTLNAALGQTDPPEEVIVIDDSSHDGTGDIAREFSGVTVIRTPAPTGSKAKAQNFGLPAIGTELVLTIDADTILHPDFTRHIKKPFTDKKVTVAAGCVLTQKTGTVWERARSTEYMFGFHFTKPIQAGYGAPMVCSGCCSAFRTETLTGAGGFPNGTVAEDMDYTWSQQIAGNRAVYVTDALCWVVDPPTMSVMRTQLHRWTSGFVQVLKNQMIPAIRHKPMLALFGAVSLFEILIAPLFLILAVFASVSVSPVSLAGWFAIDFLITVPVFLYAAVKRKIKWWHVLINVPCAYVNRWLSIYYGLRAVAVELVGVPLGITKGCTTFEKGH